MGTRILKKNSRELFLNVLPIATSKAFKKLAQEADWLKGEKWYLAGGTAMALLVGHRSSVDLDFFTTRKDFDIKKLEEKLAQIGDWKTDTNSRGTLYGRLFGAKASFIVYPFFHPAKPINYENINLLTTDDIAVMKIMAISQRGKKRDFIDMYWYCNNGGNLGETINRMLKQYPQQHNITHILKSFTFFDDAESDPMPNLNFAASWPLVKAYFRREVPRLTRKLLYLE